MKALTLVTLLCAADFTFAEKLMQLHSFDKEIDHPTFLSRWWNAGASIPLENHIVLLPSVADRFGAQWHKHPILTDNFEASFTVVLRPPASGKQPPNDQGFAFWYVYENVTDAMPVDLTESAADVAVRLRTHGWGLFGYRNKFKGLGVFFTNNKGKPDGSSEFKPSVSMLVNDGTTTVSLPMDLPTKHGSYWNFRTGGNLHVRLRVQRRSVLLEGRQDEKKGWIKLGELTSDKMPMDLVSGGYMGFTGLISSNTNPSQFGDHDSVLIDNVVLKNMDDKQKGEADIKVAPIPKSETLSEKERSEFLHDKSEEGVERAEGLAIKKFSQILFKFISETEPQKRAMMSAVSTLAGKMAAMERAVKKLKEEIVTLSGHDMDADYEKMKAELAQLSSKARSDVATKKKQFDSLKSEIETSIQSKVAAKKASTANVVKTLNEVDSKARDLKKQIASRGSFTLYVALFCVVLVVLAGVALQAKLKRWEKKHLL